VGAFLLDVVVVAVLTAALAVVVDVVLGGQRIGSGGDAFVNAAAVLGILLFPFAWFVVGEAWFRATPGKAVLGLEVTDRSGKAIGLRRAALRLLYRFSPVGMIGSLGLLVRRQSWHERWTDTVVKRRGQPIGPVGPVFAAPSAAPPHHEQAAERAAPPPLPKPEQAAEKARADHRDLESRGELSAAEQFDAVTPTAILIEAAASGAGLPATGPVDCRCAQLAQLTGDEAASYAQGHLLTVRRWPDAGHFALICPSTRLAWAASEGRGTDGEVILCRVPSLAAAGPGGVGL
jgi:uncharacterized RDD family membrane protein YckC